MSDARREEAAGDKLLELARLMESDDAEEAAGAVLVAHDLFQEIFPGFDPFYQGTAGAAAFMLEKGYRYAEHDPRRSLMHVAAGSMREAVAALRWRRKVLSSVAHVLNLAALVPHGRRGEWRRGGWIVEGATGARRSYRGDLGMFTRLVRVGEGAVLVLVLRLRGGEGVLAVFTRKGDVVTSDLFASYEVMRDWLARRLKNRASWFAGAMVDEVDADDLSTAF